ncbi:hypothetical protein RA086_05605 [Lactiplantibacillus sp. WILCCON 0030]|uniref:Phage protein n=1 Tax=Lactiplantibacillus brownii TaxID=3069269 RepID=A0ABU1A9I0_9LACO|nr:hypothetical protein [Lactiplantibacillus brownii]MDQ7937102.1 hypothetical protein [Lactiplantibacillus brownii]
MAETKKITKRTVAKKATVLKYSKADLLKSTGFTKLELDILSVALNDDTEYTFNEAKQAIKKLKEAI